MVKHSLARPPVSGGQFSVGSGFQYPANNLALVGHVTWKDRPAQPNARQQLPITITLKLGANEVNYPSTTTDANGFFTVTVSSLAPGTYNYRIKGPKYLARSSTLALTGNLVTNVEMGALLVGDANDDNIISISDFNILKNTFGRQIGDPGYDDRADFTGDQLVTITDFNLMKNNFGSAGAPPP